MKVEFVDQTKRARRDEMSVASWIDDLTADEKSLVEHVRDGRFLRFSSAPKPAIRAETIRRLMLNDPAAAEATCPNAGDMGVRLSGARITDKLDLGDFNPRHQAFPALVLEDCDFEGDIELDGAHLSRLSIRGSRIRKISLRNAEIDGTFDFSDAKPFQADDKTFEAGWIDARNITIKGQLAGSGARLQIPSAKRSENEKKRDGPMFALWLVNAEIHGSVQLRDGFAAIGGISLDAAHIQGHVLCNGAMLSAGEDDAFNAQSARIAGNLHLSKDLDLEKDCLVDGPVWLLGARIGGYAHLRGVKITVATKGLPALVLDQADIGASLQVDKARIVGGHISFVGTRVRGHIEFSELRVLKVHESPYSFLGMNADVGQNATFHGAILNGPVDLIGARINGSLEFDGAKIKRNGDDKATAALKATHLSVGGDLTFDLSDTVRRPRVRVRSRFLCRGMVDLTSAKIAGDLKFRGSHIANWSEDGIGIALRAEQIQVTGGITFSDGFEARGEVNLAGATVGRDLKCQAAQFLNAKSDSVYDAERNGPAHAGLTYGSAIYAKDIRIGDDLQFESTLAEGNLRFERADVTGSIIWDQLNISSRPHNKSPAPLDLQRARIGSALKAIKLDFADGGSEIDLTGARVSSILNYWPQGWGGVDQNYATGRQCFLKLDGLVYDRIELASVPSTRLNRALRFTWDIWRPFTGPPRHKRGDLLLDWLLHQRPPARGEDGGQKDFAPQPFRQLTRVLRVQGEEEAARTISMAENLAMPMDSRLVSLLHRPFGTLFGFGLSRRRATCALLAYLAVGTVGVHYAQQQNVLVESAIITASAFSTTHAPQRQRVFLEAASGQNTETDIPCTDTAINWPTDFVYALDMIVPFIPLHQETKCEIDPRDGARETAWRFAKAVYSIGGWIGFSLWLVTFSGLLRRYEEAE